MVLTNTSMSYELWKEIPIPMYLEFHFFNITNTHELLTNKSAKIKVAEMGPYTFREHSEKVSLLCYLGVN